MKSTVSRLSFMEERDGEKRILRATKTYIFPPAGPIFDTYQTFLCHRKRARKSMGITERKGRSEEMVSETATIIVGRNSKDAPWVAVKKTRVSRTQNQENATKQHLKRDGGAYGRAVYRQRMESKCKWAFRLGENHILVKRPRRPQTCLVSVDL